MKVEKAVELWGLQKTAEMITILRDAGSRHLINGFNNDIIVNSDGDVELVISMPDDAYYASEGRAAGRMPNIKAIEQWAAERGIKKEAAYPIALHIKKFGTKESGLHFLEKFKADEKLISTVGKAYVEEVKEELIKMTK